MCKDFEIPVKFDIEFTLKTQGSSTVADLLLLQLHCRHKVLYHYMFIVFFSTKPIATF